MLRSTLRSTATGALKGGLCGAAFAFPLICFSEGMASRHEYAMLMSPFVNIFIAGTIPAGGMLIGGAAGFVRSPVFAPQRSAFFNCVNRNTGPLISVSALTLSGVVAHKMGQH